MLSPIGKDSRNITIIVTSMGSFRYKRYQAGSKTDTMFWLVLCKSFMDFWNTYGERRILITFWLLVSIKRPFQPYQDCFGKTESMASYNIPLIRHHFVTEELKICVVGSNVEVDEVRIKCIEVIYSSEKQNIGTEVNWSS